MSRVLLVTQSTRSFGEFRRPWVRALYRRYVERFRREVSAVVDRLARDSEVTLLTSRELVDVGGLPPTVAVRYFDDESFHVTSESVKELTRHLTSAWWPPREREPSLSYRSVWLPDLLEVGRGIVLRLEVAEPLAAIERVCTDARPDRVALLSGASIPERLARSLADHRGWPVAIGAPRFWWARLYARAYAALFPREERLRLRDLLRHPRRALQAGHPRCGERALFVTCRPRHHYVVDPLVEALSAAGVEPHVVAATDQDPEMRVRLAALGDAGVAWSTLMDYLPAADAARLVQRSCPRFRALWRRIERDPGFRSRVAWNGIELADVVRPFLRDSVRRSLLSAIVSQEAAFRALDAIEPSVVLVTSSRRHAELALARAARTRRIPCILFPGTLLYSRDPSNRFDLGDRLVVIGEYLREKLVEAHVIEPRRISVVGDPRSNAARLVAPDRLRAEVVRDFELAQERPLFVMVSKYASLLFSTAEKEAFYRTVAGALDLLDAPNVIVKVHPNEDEALLRRQAREWGWPGTMFTKTYDIHRLLAVADVAIMVTSMAGIEAMALGCPVVAVQTPGKDFEGQGMPAYVSEGVVERVDMGDARGLAAALRRVVDDQDARAALIERARKFAARYVHPVDGALADRLLAVIGEIRDEAAGRRSP